MQWVFDNGTIVFLVIVVLAKIVDAMMKAAKTRREQQGEDPAAAQRRVEEVQAEIRRRIAERRAGGQARTAEAPPPPLPRPSVPRPVTTELPGGPLRRVLEEIERKVQPPAPEPPPVLVQHRRAELERQEQLAEQLRALEEAKAAAQRRAANLAAVEKAEAESEGRILAVARARTLEDLHDPQALRRAFVLREILGSPVGLR